MCRRSNAIAALVAAAAFCSHLAAHAELVAKSLGNVVVKAQWKILDDNTYLIEPGVYNLDIDGDGQFDLRFEHGFRRPPLYVSREASEQLNFALREINEIQYSLTQVRNAAVKTANAGVNDDDSFQDAQGLALAYLDNVDRLSQMTFQGQRLLGGDAGYATYVSNESLFKALRADDNTLAGSYQVTVQKPGTRAFLAAQTIQTARLAYDELLSINGVNVQLFSGMDQQAVIDRINEYSVQTGVFGTNRDGRTTLVSNTWGRNGSVVAISNHVASFDSTGIPNTLQSSFGEDIEVEVEGGIYKGDGDTVTINAGPAKGLTLRALETATDATRTIPSGLGATVTVSDDSLQYLLRPTEEQQYITVTYPNLHTSALGTGVDGNQFPSLDRIRLTSAAQAQDSLVILDAASDEVQSSKQELERIQKIYNLPRGQAYITSLQVSSESDIAVDFQPLSEGALIDDQSTFGDGPIDLITTPDTSDMGRFVGFRFFDGAERHYGWIRFALGEDDTIVLKQWVFESKPGLGVRVGYVPEPTASWLALIGLACALPVSRNRPSV